MEVAVEGDGIGYDPETGMLKRSRVSFSSLHDAIAAALPEQSAALLLYLLLHGNRDYLDYSLSRTDPETILEAPASSATRLEDSSHQPVRAQPSQAQQPAFSDPSLSLSLASQALHALILLLILSQDAGFVTACQTSILSSVPWYKDRLLGKISVGSLMVIVLVRTVQVRERESSSSSAAATAKKCPSPTRPFLSSPPSTDQPRRRARLLCAHQLSRRARQHRSPTTKAAPTRGAVPHLAERPLRAKVFKARESVFVERGWEEAGMATREGCHRHHEAMQWSRHPHQRPFRCPSTSSALH